MLVKLYYSAFKSGK